MIIGASPMGDGKVFQEFDPKDYFIICADGGYETALKYGITPDYIVGDFDSVKKMPSPKDHNIKVLPAEKDVTDTMYAAQLGLRKGLNSFVLIGCLHGPRHDHTMANFHVMLYIIKKGGTAIMADAESKTFLLGESRLRITGQKNSTLSVFPFGSNSCNVSYKGLKYPLDHWDLSMGDTLMGVSNEITDSYAEIVVHAGYAMVILFNKRIP